MAADELRLSDDAENDLAIREGDLADREALGLLHEYRGEPGGGAPPPPPRAPAAPRDGRPPPPHGRDPE